MASTRMKINGRWIDVPDRPNGVRASIRRNNGGKLITETTASTDKSFMPYDERYQKALAFLDGARRTPSENQREAAVGALEGAGGSATLTKKGATGLVVKGAPQSPMAGARDTRGLAWDAIRAGIHERATKNVFSDMRLEDENSKVDMASEESKKSVLGNFDKSVARERDRLAGQFADNLVKSVQDNVDRNRKPLGPKPSERASTASAAFGAAQTSGDVGAMRSTLQGWRKAIGADQPKVEIQQKTTSGETVTRRVGADTAEYLKQSQAQTAADQKWIDDMKRQMGMQSAAKGGSAHSIPVSRSEDRFLDDLIGEMEV